MLFSASPEFRVTSLYRIDQTNNAHLVKASTEFWSPVAFDHKVFFKSGDHLWSTDGKTSGTVIVTDEPSVGARLPVQRLETLYGVADHLSLYRQSDLAGLRVRRISPPTPLPFEFEETAILPDGSLEFSFTDPDARNFFFFFFFFFHHLSKFTVNDEDGSIALRVDTADEESPLVDLKVKETDKFPTDSVFASLEESSQFFESGCVGYSSRPDSCVLDGLLLLNK